jgi:hypothetical protein
MKGLVEEWMKNPNHAKWEPIEIKESTDQFQACGTATCPHWAKFMIKMHEIGEEIPREAVNNILGRLRYSAKFRTREYPRDYDDFIMLYGHLRGSGKKPLRVGKKKLTDRE